MVFEISFLLGLVECHLSNMLGSCVLTLTVCGMKSCRLLAIPYPVTQKLKRATTLEQPTEPAIFYTVC
jgi:hypothetical protein